MASLGFVFDAAAHQALSNLSVALDLARQGIPVFPCHPGGEKVKQPLPGVFWRNAATTDERRVAQWWEQHPDALPAINLERADLIVIDCDGSGGVEDWHGIRANRPDSASIVETPSGGEHRYFKRGGRALGNGRGSLPPKRGHDGIDVRGAGGYVIAPGATLLDGRRYEPNGYDILSAPEIPDWLISILQAPTYHDAPAEAVRFDPGPPVSDERKRAYGERALDEEMRDLSMAPPGTRNETANVSAFRIGQLVGGGCLTESEAYAALHNAALTWGISAKDKALGPKGTIARAIRDGARSPRYCPEAPDQAQGAEIAAALLARQIVETPEGALADAETGEVIEQDRAHGDDPLGEDYAFGDITRPDGLIGQMTDWIVATSRKPNRSLAMTAAIAVMCGVCSRHMMGPTSSATHLFLVNLGATSVGKDRPLKAMDQILTAAGFGAIYQTAKFKSDTAIELMLKSAPTAVASVDEIGSAIFAKMGGRRATTHESSISAVLRELWSVLPGDTFQTSSRAGERSEKLESPALTLMGASTLNEFYKSLTGASVDNGFLNRFTILMADPASEERDELVDRRFVPDTISRGLAALMPKAGNLDGLTALLGRDHPVNVLKIEWASPEVGEFHLAFSRRITRWRDEDEAASGFLGRTAEMAVRLATVHAVGRQGRDARVTERDYRWGASVALASARFMIEDASLRMAETDYQSNLKFVLAFIKSEKRVKRMQITRKVDGRWDAGITDKILRSLAEGGQIGVVKGESSNEGGRKPDVYVYLKEKRTCA
jgi:hypothetical protein